MARCMMRSIYAGPKGTIQPGRVFEGTREEVDALVAGGFATLLSDGASVARETASGEAPENAEVPRPRRMGRTSEEE
jgi:hypothetical protein